MAGPIAKYRITVNPQHLFGIGSFAESMSKYFAAEVIGDETPLLSKQLDVSVEVQFYEESLVKPGTEYLQAGGLNVEQIV